MSGRARDCYRCGGVEVCVIGSFYSCDSCDACDDPSVVIGAISDSDKALLDAAKQSLSPEMYEWYMDKLIGFGGV